LGGLIAKAKALAYLDAKARRQYQQRLKRGSVTAFIAKAKACAYLEAKARRP